MEKHFPIKPGQPIGMVVACFYSFAGFPNKDKESVCQMNGTANFGRNIATELSGPPPEVIPNSPVRRNRNGSFHSNSDPNLRNLRQNGKHSSKMKGMNRESRKSARKLSALTAVRNLYQLLELLLRM